MHAHSRETQATMTPAKSLAFLREGNQRFLNNLRVNRNLLRQVNETKAGQFPFAVILSCIDSRTSAELIFDQGLGDVISIRVAGNVLNDDVIGSMEFACAVAGSKLILVLGHTGCGAVQCACRGIRFGSLAGIVEKLRPSLESVQAEDPGWSEERLVAEVAHDNARRQMYEILDRSPALHDLYAQGRIGLAAAIYSVESGMVTFFDELLDDTEPAVEGQPASA